MSDIILARFIRYMEVVLYHKRVDYINKLIEIENNEEELQDYKIDKTEEINFDSKDLSGFEMLNEKEKKLLELIYIKGYTYKEISEMTNETIDALEKRRYRAIKKLKGNRR